MKTRKPKIGVISFPQPSILVTDIFLSNLIEILQPICGRIYLVTSNNGKSRIFDDNIKMVDLKIIMHNTIWPRWWSILLQSLKIMTIQIKMCWTLVKISKDIDIVMFYVGGANLFPPVLAAKFLRKKVLMIQIGTGSSNEELIESANMDSILPYLLCKLEKTIYSLSDQIVIDINVESDNLIRQFGLEEYKHKLSFGASLFIDTNNFRIKKKLGERKSLIGYIGRHSLEKGVLNFARAIPLILKERKDLEFVIGSGGPLSEDIKYELKKNGTYDKVTFTGWVARENLPDSFNELKLIVVPSYTETIPNVILEAMACGTPVVAAPAGAIPDLINDGENGFLMKDNSPQCIAENVIRAINDPHLDKIVQKANTLINTEYSYNVIVEKFKKLIRLENFYEMEQ